MAELMMMAQLSMMFLSSPMYFCLSVYVMLRRPVVSSLNHGDGDMIWSAMSLVLLAFAMVSLRDWYVFLNNDIHLSMWGVMVRAFKFVAGVVLCYAAWKER